MESQRRNKCPRCQTWFASSALGDLCPRCVGRMAFSADSPSSALPDVSWSALAGEAAESIAPHSLSVAGYEVFEEIGRGGMGVVYRARHAALNRIVALKTMTGGGFSDSVSHARFRREARAAAALQHPNIVAVHDFGEAQGQTFFTMDYVEGPTLAALVRSGPLDPRCAAGIVRKIALAVEHGHACGILHRDLKPTNVLLDSGDEPRVTDFGLAKDFRDAADLTMSGQPFGSPEFMAPEQATGSHREVGPPTDVYGLGGILYFLLTGRPPFCCHSAVETVRQVADQEPIPPFRLNPSVPRDLNTLCLKCLSKQPAQRYATAAQVAEECERFLAGRPILARPPGIPERVWRWCRRRPVLAGLSASAAALLLTVMVGGPLAVVKIERARHEAAAAARSNAENLYAADVNLAFAALAENRMATVRELLQAHVPSDPQSDLRGWEWHYLWQASQSDELVSLEGHQGPVHCLAFSPDGRLLASGGGREPVIVWDVASRSQVATIAHAGYVPHVGFAPDGRSLLTANTWVLPGRTILRSWRFGEWQTPATAVEIDCSVQAFELSHDGRHLLVTTLDGGAKLYVAASGRLQQTITEWPARLLFSRGARGAELPRLAVRTKEGTALWDVETGESVQAMPFDTDALGLPWFPPVLRLSPKGDQVVAGGDWLRVFDLARGDSERLAGEAVSRMVSVDYSPDGTVFASGHEDATLRIWDAASLALRTVLKGHDNAVTQVVFSPDGRILASAGLDHSVKLWDPTHPGRAYPVQGAPQYSKVSSCGNTALFQTGLSRVELYVVAGGALEVRGLDLPAPPLDTVRVSSTGRFLCYQEDPGTYVVRDSAALRQVASLCGAAIWLDEHHVFSPDDSMIVGRDQGRRWHGVWDVQSGRRVAELGYQGGGDGERAFWGSDNRTIMLADPDHQGVRLWRIDQPEHTPLLNHPGYLARAMMSPDSKLIAALTWNGHIKVWDAETREELHHFTNRGPVEFPQLCHPMTFTPDSRRLIVAAGGPALGLYDLVSGRQLGSLPLEQTATGCFFSPDGVWLGVMCEQGPQKIAGTLFLSGPVAETDERGGVAAPCL